MTRLFAVSAGLAMLLAAAPALAQEVAGPPPPPPPPPDPTGGLVIAGDPVPVPVPVPVPDPVPAPAPVPEQIVEPYYDPYIGQPIADPVAPPPRERPGESWLAYGAANQVNVSGDSGLEAAGWGGTAGISWIERRGDMPGGVDLAATFLSGDSISIYDLSIRVMATPKLNGRVLSPYIALGFCAGASRIITDRQRMTGENVDFGLAIGPSGGIGVHGFVGDKLYWRAGAGFLGAGVGAVTADLAVGMVVD